MPNILVAEDNASLRTLIHIHLTKAGYTVFDAEDGVQAMELLDHNPINLIITNVMMPTLDGYSLARELRNAQIQIPILVVTVKDSLDDKREGFVSGADDYMVKPLDMEELLLRVDALLRRCHMESASSFSIGDCTLYPDSLTVVHQSEHLHLRKKEFMLLKKLLSTPNKIFTRQALMDDIWGFDSESTSRTVDTHIKRLREKLSSVSAFEIQTIRGLGYRAVIHK